MNSPSLLQQFKSLYELFPDFVCTLDPNGKIIDCNERALEFFSYKKEEVIERSCLEFILPEYRESALKGFETINKDGIGKGTELVFIRRDGTTFNGLAKGAKLTDDSNQLTGYLVSIKDITYLHNSIQEGMKRETAMIQKLEEVIRSQNMKEDLILKLKNDVLVSVCSLKCFIDMLILSGSFSEDQQKSMDVVKLYSDKLLRNLEVLTNIPHTQFNENISDLNEMKQELTSLEYLYPLNTTKFQVNLRNKSEGRLLNDRITHSFALTEYADAIHITKPVMKKIFSLLTSMEINEIALTFSNNQLKNKLENTHSTLDTDTLLNFLKNTTQASRFEFVHYENDSLIKISITHNMGLKWSLFLTTAWESFLNDLGYEIQSEYSENVIRISIQRYINRH